MKEEVRKAPRGEGMITLTVKLWTDGIVEGQKKGFIVPKHAWNY